MRIATRDRHRGEHRDQHVVEAHVEPGGARELLVVGDREQLRGAGRHDATSTTAASATLTHTSEAEMVVIEPKR